MTMFDMSDQLRRPDPAGTFSFLSVNSLRSPLPSKHRTIPRFKRHGNTVNNKRHSTEAEHNKLRTRR
jgi:hypothetical protein